MIINIPFLVDSSGYIGYSCPTRMKMEAIGISSSSSARAKLCKHIFDRPEAHSRRQERGVRESIADRVFSMEVT